MTYSVCLIKPSTIGRGDGPDVLSDMLDKGDLSLLKFKAWNVCSTTWSSLEEISKDTESALVYKDEIRASGRASEAWACLVSTRRDEHPTIVLNRIFGPNSFDQWRKNHLRYKYSAFSRLGKITHPSDTVVYIAPEGKEPLIASLLFVNFEEEMYL